MFTTHHPEKGITMSGSRKAPQNPLTIATGNVSFTGTEYTEALAVRLATMHGVAEGSVDTATKNAARAVVRRARAEIKKAGMTVEEWRTLEATRETALAESKKRARKPRAKKGEVATPEATVPPAEEANQGAEVAA